MADKLMNFLNNDTKNYLFCRLQLVVETLPTQLNKPNNQNSINSPQIFKANE